MKKIVAAVLVASIATLAYLAMRESTAARTARAARDMAVEERDALRARVTALEKQTATLTSANSALQAQVDATPPAPPSPPPEARTFTRAMPRGRMAGPMAMFDSPEMRQLMAVEQKGRLDSRYAGLFQALRLPPEKLDQLKQLLVDKQSTAMDVISAAHQQNLIGPGTGGDVHELVQQETAALDSSIRDLLGDTAFEEYQDFERTRAERNIVDRLASRLSYSESPLDPAQSEALIDLLSAQRATQPAAPPAGEQGVRMAVAIGSTDAAFSFGGPGASDSLPITESTVTSAESVLNEAQLAALRQLQAEQQAQQKMGELFRQNLPSSPPGGGATWTTAPLESSRP